MSNVNQNSTVQETEHTCPATGYQKLNVCVPVKVTPHAVPGTTVTHCCNAPTVNSGDTTCDGTEDGSCYFTISQALCIEVPVVFSATASVGKTYVDCIEASNENLCKGCKEF